MSLSVPSYADPQTGESVSGAYAWISEIRISFASGTGQGQVEVAVNRTAAAAQALLPPMDRLVVHFGCPVPVPGQAVADPGSVPILFPTLTQLVTAAAGLQVAAAGANPPVGLDPFSAIREAAYQALPLVPALAGSTTVA